jgi:hypothetical protein
MMMMMMMVVVVVMMMMMMDYSADSNDELKRMFTMLYDR